MRTVRTVFFWLHLIVGVAAGVVILAMSLTGLILAFERQIKTVADSSAAHVSERSASAPTNPDAILSALERDGRGSPSTLVLHSDPRAAVEARFGRERSLYLDPSTGQVIGEPSARMRAFFSSVETVHRSLGLGMQSAFGRGVTGAANLGFLFMVASGVYLWMPKIPSRTALRNRFWFRRRLHGRARDWNWHSVLGIWTAVPLFFIVLTGVIMSYPWANNLLYTITGTQPPPPPSQGERRPQTRPGPRQARKLEPSPASRLQTLLTTAEQRVPEWRTVTITLPQPEDRALNLSLDKSGGGHPEQVTQIALNLRTGQIESFRPFNSLNSGRKLRAWSRFLHTGEEFGVVGEAIGAIACIGSVLLVYTGFSMFVRRIRRSRIGDPMQPVRVAPDDSSALSVVGPSAD